MNHDSTTPAGCAVDGCPNNPFMEHLIRLCRNHGIQVSVHVTDALYANALVGSALKPLAEQASDTLITEALIADSSVWSRSSHEPVVYFIANGDRIKIGTTTGVRARVSSLALRKHHALLVLNGGYGLESALHQLFAAERLGNSEWFALSTRLSAFIDAKGGAVGEVPASSPPPQARAGGQGAHEGRRAVVFDIVTKAGPNGIGPAAILDILGRQHPGLKAPHPDVIARWLGADPRIHKPKQGRYALRPDQT